MTSRFLTGAAIGISLALFGAGCAQPQPPTPVQAPTQKPPTQASVPASQGFGKLPAINVATSNAPSRSNALTLDAAQPKTGAMSSAPQGSGGAGVGYATAGYAVASPAVIGSAGTVSARPIPSPYPRPFPATVEYTISTALPSWNNSGDILRVVRPEPDLSGLTTLARASGVPTQTTAQASTVQSVNLSWRDTAALTWTLDAGNRTLSFWKDQSAQKLDQQQKTQTVPDAELKMIAANFLRDHGFTALASTEGAIQNQQIMPMQGNAKMMDSAAMYPCPVLLEGQSGSGGGGAPAAPPMAVDAPMIYPPYPCGWSPQVTIVYSGQQDGKNVVDAGGNPFQNAAITIDLSTKTVTNGYIQLDQQTERSSYALIDVETAKKRLQSGGQNPVYPWGNEATIKVSLTAISVVWLRYDSWQDGTTQTYYLPALLATGTVNRGIKGQAPEDYRTLVPLVVDDAFDGGATTIIPPTPAPMPMMKATPTYAEPAQ